ncbi:WD40 repeat domain-containing protein [Micromonospora mangrovi]|uniref:WD40 repeat domain-containing protein n=2 Tax=Micromonospora TaxID=1873 RepID=A0AAU7MDB2_9ACTN
MTESHYQGVQFGDHNIQYNCSGPVVRTTLHGPVERMQDVCFDPVPLERDLGLARFTGRDWLIAQIDSFLSANARGYVLIQGEAGVGKSTLAAHLVRTRPWLHHFTRLPGGRSAPAARRSLAAQLITRWKLAEEWAPGGVLPLASGRPDWFGRLVHAAARERDQQTPGEPIVLVVDGLDEVDDGSDATELPLGLPVSLPDGVFVVATSRFGIDRALHGVRRPAVWLEIDVDGRDNLVDIRRFIADVTDPDRGDERLHQAVRGGGTDLEWFREAVARSCAGVWIYLQYVLDEIREGVRDPRSVAALPSDLAGYYAEQIGRWRSQATQQQWAHVTLPLLGVLGAARAPLTVEQLAAFAGVPSIDTVRVFTEETIRPFLRRHDDESVELRHQSLRDLIEGNPSAHRPDVAGLARQLAAQVRLAHRAITDGLTPPGALDARDWRSAGSYARHHLAAHAAVAGSLDALVCDPGFLLAASPGSIVARRDSLHTPDGKRALAAFELSLYDWVPSADAQNLTRLAANAARLGSAALVAACRHHTDGEWQTLWASWGGHHHRKLASGDDVVCAVEIARADGREVIVSGCFDGVVRIWDAVSGDPCGAPLAHDAAVTAVATGRIRDHDVIVTGTEEGTVHIWNAASGEPLGAPPAGHRGVVCAVAIGRVDGRDVIVTGGDDTTARLWNAVTGEQVRTLTGHHGGVRAVAIGRVDGRDVIVTGGDDTTARLWNAVTGEEARILTCHHGAVRQVAIGRIDGRDVIVTNAYDTRDIFAVPPACSVRVWDAVTGRCSDVDLDHDATAMSMTIGRIAGHDVIITGSAERTIRIWDAATGVPLGAPLAGHSSSVTSVTLGRIGDREVIVSGSGDGTVRIWEATVGDPATVAGHRYSVQAVAVGRAGDRDVVVSGGRDGTVRTWDALSGAPVSVLAGHGSPVNAVAIGQAAGRSVIISGCEDRTACVWDAVTGDLIRVLVGHSGEVRSVAIGPAGDRDVILTGCGYQDDKIRIWDAASGVRIGTLPVDHGPWSLAIGRAGHRDVIVCGSSDEMIHVWDAVTGERTCPPMPGYVSRRPPNTGRREVRCVAIGRAGDRDVIVSGTWEGTVRIWDAVTGQPTGAPLTGHRDGVWSVAIGRGGSRDLVVSGSRDNTVRIWDAVTGASIGPPLTGHHGWVHAVAIGRAGDRDLIVSGSADTTLIASEHRPHPGRR